MYENYQKKTRTFCRSRLPSPWYAMDKNRVNQSKVTNVWHINMAHACMVGSRIQRFRRRGVQCVPIVFMGLWHIYCPDISLFSPFCFVVVVVLILLFLFHTAQRRNLRRLVRQRLRQFSFYFMSWTAGCARYPVIHFLICTLSSYFCFFSTHTHT